MRSSLPWKEAFFAVTVTLRVVELMNVTVGALKPPEIVTVAPLTNPVPTTLKVAGWLLATD